MKDLEKIKSEDLAAQVQDANPANFAIEQEVAAMVGATVPQPTQPSEDDARELGAQLLVFLHRALLPIRSALRTAVAAIYAHLDSRCTAYTPAAYAPYMPLPSYDPMGPFVPRTLPNLLTALTSFAPRKISNGSAPSDGIPDGTSLAHLLCSTDAVNAVTEICDDNTPYVASRMLTNLINIFPNLTKIRANITRAVGQLLYGGNVQDLELPYLKVGACNTFGGRYITHKGKRLVLPELTHFGYINETTPESDYYGGLLGSDSETEELICPKLRYIASGYFLSTRLLGGPTKLRRFVMDKPAQEHPCMAYGETKMFGGRGDYAVWRLIDVEICCSGDLLDHSFNMDSWEPKYALMSDPTEEGYIDLRTDMSLANNLEQFLTNFKDHIALRLTDQGSGKTLTLSQAVFSAVIEGSSPICDDIKGIIEDKGWKVQDTNNNIFPTT